MPLIQVKLVDQAFTPAQKDEVIAKLTNALVSIEGENMRPVTLVVIEDVHSSESVIVGKPMRSDAVRALAASKS